ncbi:B12-binding domain-containing radical SAM protein [Haloimpatiens massiliensis]|uniref:B12-binding domain-containing radical SAM protein n=1 Tax=Haloimpatiens massiliensis TaxID=1658110 RepID=UPI000C8681AC|nr:radical SAM protein [Haloimpatiens massiliensis]
MKKIVFINSVNDIRKKNNFSIGSFSLGTILRKHGYFVRIIDFDYLMNSSIIKNNFNKTRQNIHTMCDYIINNQPNVVCFYTMSNSYYLTIKLAKLLKSKNPNIKIVFGGPQATLTARKTLEICGEWIDAIGLGEGESSIVNIIDNLINNTEFTDEIGVAYLKNGEIILNKTVLIDNLDDLEMIDYSLLEGTFEESIDLDVGRGCPFACKYCSTKTFWKRNFRLKSSERIIKEIEDLNQRFNINKFNFEHDLFTANKKKVLDFCDKLISSNININWTCSSRADTLDEELISKMREAGCEAVFLGIESGSTKMQKIINKNLNLNKALETTTLLKKYNMEIVTSFIYGFPEENENDVNDTIEMIYKMIRIGVHRTQLHLFSLFPGTQYYEELKNNLYLSKQIPDGSCSIYVDNDSMYFIEKNKEVFPQYLDFKVSIREDLKFLDIYILTYSRVLMKYMNTTYKFLIKNVFGNHLKLFKKFREVNIEQLKLYENLIYKIQLNPKNCIRDLGNLINSCDFENKDILYEIYLFESDIVNFIYYSQNDKFLNSYKYDVYTIKSCNLDLKLAKHENTNICFTRLNNNNDLNIKKVV